MPTRILIATDFSDVSQEATRQAHAIAARDNAALGVCHVIPDPLPTISAMPIWLDSQVADQAAAESAARMAVDTVASSLARGGVGAIEAFVDRGDAAAAVVRRAERFGADLVVVGSHGRTGIARILLGSVAEKVVRHAHCAVLIARSGPAAGPVVTSSDLSEAARPGLRAAALEAARTNSPLVAIHSIELGWPGDTPYAIGATGLSSEVSDKEALARATTSLEAAMATATRDLHLRWSCEILVGEPATLIVERAEALQARLVVLSTHGRTGLSRLLLGSVAEVVLRHAHTSVLAVRGAAA